MKKTISMFFACTLMLVTMGMVSCQEKTVVLGDPYVDSPTRAMLMEKIAVAYRNVSADTEVIVDFGDGSSPEVTNGPIAITHQYTSLSPQTDRLSQNVFLSIRSVHFLMPSTNSTSRAIPRSGSWRTERTLQTNQFLKTLWRL